MGLIKMRYLLGAFFIALCGAIYLTYIDSATPITTCEELHAKQNGGNVLDSGIDCSHRSY